MAIPTIINATTTSTGTQVVTTVSKVVSPWLLTLWRFIEVLIYAAIAAGVEYLISYAQAGKLSVSPVMVGVLIAGLSAVAKLVKEKQRAVDIQEAPEVDPACVAEAEESIKL